MTRQNPGRAFSTALLVTVLALASTLALAPAALAAPGDEGASPLAAASPAAPSTQSDGESYEGGTIPILKLTFCDDVDSDTGEVTLTGDEKIDLMNESANHAYKAEGVTADLIVPAAYDNPDDDLLDGVSGYTGETNLPFEFIRGRGNSTWRAAKKPYKFKLDAKADLFGMGANKHWVLLANAYDSSLSVNRIVSWLGKQMGMPFTPRGVPVDLFMNGRYCGNYFLTEEVRVDKSRVEIDEVDKNASDPASLEITGDYLIGMNRKPTAAPSEYFSTSRGNAFSWDTPEYEPPLTQAQEAQQAYLKAHLDRVEDAIYAKGFVSASGDYVWDLVDKASLADYWWVQEFTGNRDGFATPSTYLYKLRDQAAADGKTAVGKLCWGPLWDFDFVWGDFEAAGFDNTEAKWVSILRQDPGFVELLKERWSILDEKLESLVKEGGLLDAYAEEMGRSWEANRQRWPNADQHGWKNGSYRETLEELRSHIEARRAWIGANLDQLQTSYFTLAFMDGEDELLSTVVRGGSPSYVDPPEAVEKDGMLFDGWFTDDGEEYEPDAPVVKDAVYRAKYLDAATVVAATDVCFAQPEQWTQYGTRIRYDLMPADAKDMRVVWSSSDESIATVDEHGYVSFADGCLGDAATAEVTVTAHLVGSGNEASVRVVLYDPERIALPAPTSITFEDAIEVEVDSFHQLRPVVEPSPSVLDEDFGLFFGVEDESIAAVTSNGVVVGKAPGTTTVTVTRPNPETWESETVSTIAVTVTDRETEPSDPELVDISKRKVALSKASFAYTGKAIRPAVKVKGLEPGCYTVKYANNKKVGTATITVKGKKSAGYKGSATKTFKIVKAKNPLSIKGRTVVLRAKALKGKAQKLASSEALKLKKSGKGKLSYAKVKGTKKIAIGKKTGAITVKRGLKKGTYAIKVKVRAAGTANYKAATRTATFKVVVK